MSTQLCIFLTVTISVFLICVSCTIETIVNYFIYRKRGK